MKLSVLHRRKGFCLALPFLTGFTLFYLLPFLYSIALSFTKGIGRKQFVAFNNYINVFKSEAFLLALKNTAKFIGIAVPLIIILAFMLSLILNEQLKGISFFRSAVLFPLVVPIAGTVMFFQVIFAQNGALNNMLEYFNLKTTDWLNSPFVFYLLVLIYIWKNCGYIVVLFLSALNSIPKVYYEAAELEGAGRLQKFKTVTIPCIAPMGFFVVVISIVNCFKSFREAFMLGGVTPHSSIYMLQHFMNNNFENVSYGRLSVGAITTFALIFAIILGLYILKNKSTIVEV